MLLGDLCKDPLEYFALHDRYMRTVPHRIVAEYLKVLKASVGAKRQVVLLGNGGSCSNAQHAAVDLQKATRFDLKVLALGCPSAITAEVNDSGELNMFENLLTPYLNHETITVVVALSVSGDSENIVNAMKLAGEYATIRVAFTGMDGGVLRNVCDYHINVPSQNYGVVEDIHLAIHHAVAQALGG